MILKKLKKEAIDVIDDSKNHNIIEFIIRKNAVMIDNATFYKVESIIYNTETKDIEVLGKDAFPIAYIFTPKTIIF